MKKKLHLLTVILMLWGINLQAQSPHLMTGNNTIFTSSTTFYDDGGELGNVGENPLITTFVGTSKYIELYFEDFDIPEGAVLNIYKGTPNDGELLGVITKGHKPHNLKAKIITVEYIPAENQQPARGWKGIIREAAENLMEKAMLPESDCINAIQICSNSTVNTSANQYEDTGAVNDDSGSCYGGTGSGGSVWYQFSPQNNGPLDFAINPSGSTDYDFVLWDITNGCASRTEISCNWCAPTGPTGLSTSGAATNSQGSSGTNFNQRVNVDATRVYAICINYYSGTNDGFVLTFRNDPTSVSIVDNTPPTITNAYGNSCTSSTTLDVYFSEWMDCSTLQASDFTIPGRTITLNTTNCTGSPSKTNHIVINVSPALAGPGTYILTGVNVNDMCGNPLNDTYDIVFGVAPVANAGPDRVVCRSAGFFGTYNYTSVTLTGSGGTNQFWSTGQSGASISVSPHSPTIYTMTAQNGGCTASDNVLVTVEDTPAPNLGSDQTICAGFPANLNGTVSIPGVVYQWQMTTTTFFGSPTGWANIAGATNPTLTHTPTVNPTYYRVLVTSPGGCQGNDVIRINQGAGNFNINTSKAFACAGESITLSVPGGITSYTWSTGTSSDAPLTVTPASTTVYSVTSTTAGCAGSASVTVPVRPIQTVTATANPTMVCPGTPVDLTASPNDISNNVTENFEGATQTFTLVNGTYNRWYHGASAFCSGTKGLYIGTAVGNNNYTISSGFGGLTSNAATNHAYRNYTVTSYCNATLSFDWRNNGNSNAELSVFLVPTTFTPVAGTAITPTATEIRLGGPYFDGMACANVVYDLSPYAGQTVRIVFQWRNTGGFLAPAVENTAAMIDNIVFNESTTYGYNWTSSPAGFSSTFQNPTVAPTVNTTYSLEVVRCDGCASSMNTDITMCPLLPLELVNFSGDCKGHQAAINWQTLSEQGVDYFSIERSTDGVHFEVIARENAKGQASYYTLNRALAGMEHNYFRLKQIDIDGSEFYSNIIHLDCNAPVINQFNIYPNPTDDELNISFNANYQSKIKISLLDVLGKTVFEKEENIGLGINDLKLNLSKLPAAVYVLKIEDIHNEMSPKLYKVVKD